MAPFAEINGELVPHEVLYNLDYYCLMPLTNSILIKSELRLSTTAFKIICTDLRAYLSYFKSRNITRRSSTVTSKNESGRSPKKTNSLSKWEWIISNWQLLSKVVTRNKFLHVILTPSLLKVSSLKLMNFPKFQTG